MTALSDLPLVLCELGETEAPGLESYSPFCLKVHRALRAAGLAYSSRRGRMPSDFRSLNPTAQVPVLLVGDEPVCDSTRIVERIVAMAPGARDAYFGRAPWLVRTVVAPAIRRRVMRGLVVRDVLRAGEHALSSEYRSTLDRLEARAPRTGFWLGDTVGVADVALFAQLRSLKSALTPWQAREIELRPTLVDWIDRVDAATSAVSSSVRGERVDVAA